MKTSKTKLILAIVTSLTFMLFNASPSVASECIVSGETKCATIEFGGETHSYYFWAEAGQGVVIEMADLSVSVSDSNALAGLEPRIQLYAPNGIRIADSGWDYSRAAIDNCPLTMTGTYTIVASDVDASGGYGVYWRETIPDTGDYGLSLVVTEGTTTCLQDRDGGDMTDGRTQSGTITPGGDLDAYVFYGQPGQGVAIELADRSTSGVLEPRVRLYDPNGVLVADSGWKDSYAAIENYQLKMAGIHTVVVSEADASGGYGVYWREYTPDTGEYGLSVSVMPPKNPYGLYPYHPLPADGNSVSLCEWDTLSWWPVDGATGYDVYFAGSPCTPLEKMAQNIPDPYMLIPPVEEEQVCYWKVVAHTSDGDIEGPTWWFATQPCPPSPCSLSLSAIGQGSIVDPNEPSREYPCGEVVPVIAVADPDFEFVRWEGSAVDANKVVIENQDTTGSQVWVTVDGPYTLKAIFEEVLFDFPLDIDPGWTRDGQWEFGTPSGQGGDQYGNSDPTSGYTGPNVLGVNLNGDYDVRVGGPYCLVAGPFDLRSYRSVRLSFWSWLNTDWADYVKNSLEMSLDGKTWLLVTHNPQREAVADSTWSRWECAIDSWADNEPQVYLRWSYQILAERAYPYSGWNLDDIQLCGKRQ
jgi:hypothetical protein